MTDDRPDVLVVTHRVPYPPDKGERIRTYHMIRGLAPFARIHLATLADEPTLPDHWEALHRSVVRAAAVDIRRGRLSRGLGSLIGGRSISEGVFRSAELKKLVRKWAAETPFSAAIATASSVAEYLRIPELNGARRVIDMIDVDSRKWFDYAADVRGPKRMLYRLEGKRVAQAERRICTWADSVTLVSDAESAILREETGFDRIHTLTNGVDLDYYRHLSAGGPKNGCVFIGGLDYKPNVDAAVWFARTVWSEIRNHHPSARFRIVGRKPVPAVRELASIPGVDVIGQVPDVRPYLAESAVVVAPLLIARGLQTKVLEAMAASQAVVASSPALGGFGNRPDLPCLRCDSREQWIDTVRSLLADPQRCRQLGAAGRAYAETRHDWADCLKLLHQLLNLTPVVSAGLVPVGSMA